jgi:hypothetical protein
MARVCIVTSPAGAVAGVMWVVWVVGSSRVPLLINCIEPSIVCAKQNLYTYVDKSDGEDICERLPRVEAGKNLSPVIPASRKRRGRGTPVSSEVRTESLYTS